MEGGYEQVPTRDIHMNSVGFEKEWLTFLDVYVRPQQEAVWLQILQKVWIISIDKIFIGIIMCAQI